MMLRKYDILQSFERVFTGSFPEIERRERNTRAVMQMPYEQRTAYIKECLKAQEEITKKE